MPVYEYEDERSGQTVELVRPIAQRDRVPRHLRRRRVPRRINFVTGAPDPTDASVATPRAFRQLEDTIPADRIARESGFSTERIKQIWGM